MMFSQSLTIKILKFFCEKFKTSLFYGLFLRISNSISKIYNKSMLKKYINSKFFLNNLWSKSFIAGVLDTTINIFCKIIIVIGNFINKQLDDGVVGIIYRKIQKKIKIHHIMAFIFGIMFLIYSDKWNNMYAVCISIIFTFIIIYKNRNNLFQPSKLDFFMVLFLLSIPLGIISSTDKVDSIRIAILLVAALLFQLSVTFTLNNNKKVIEFTKIMSIAIFLTAIFAIIQRVMGLVEVNLGWVDVEVNAGMPARVFSTMENPNNYAELLVLFIPFMFALFINEKKSIFKVMWIIVIGTSIVALLMTYSRSCYVAVVLAIIVFLLIYDYKLLFPVIICGLLAIPFLPETIINRIFTIGSFTDKSNIYRLYIWDICIRLIGNYGICGLGIGPQAFRSYYRPISYKKSLAAVHSHMFFMELILEHGIIGFIGFIGYYIRIIRNGFMSVKLATKNQKVFLAAGLGTLIGISFMWLADDIWYYPRAMFAFFIVLGMVSAIIRNIQNKEIIEHNESVTS